MRQQVPIKKEVKRGYYSVEELMLNQVIPNYLANSLRIGSENIHYSNTEASLNIRIKDTIADSIKGTINPPFAFYIDDTIKDSSENFRKWWNHMEWLEGHSVNGLHGLNVRFTPFTVKVNCLVCCRTKQYQSYMSWLMSWERTNDTILQAKAKFEIYDYTKNTTEDAFVYLPVVVGISDSFSKIKEFDSYISEHQLSAFAMEISFNTKTMIYPEQDALGSFFGTPDTTKPSGTKGGIILELEKEGTDTILWGGTKEAKDIITERLGDT